MDKVEITNEIATVIMTVLVIPLLGYITKALVDGFKSGFALLKEWIKDRRADKYLEEAEKAAKAAVEAVHQTLVEGIKGTSKWTPDYHKYIFENAKERALKSITRPAQRMLDSLYEDTSAWLDTKINSELALLKIRLKQEEAGNG